MDIKYCPLIKGFCMMAECAFFDDECLVRGALQDASLLFGKLCDRIDADSPLDVSAYVCGSISTICTID